jgi:hypothetical protein
MLEMLIPLLSRWKWGLALAGLLAFTGLGAAALHYRAALRIERAGRAADRASYVAAQAEATRLSAEAIHHQEAVYRMKAAQQDTAHEADLSAARAAGAAYADAHRLRGQALGGAPGPAPAAPAPDPAGLREGLPAAGVVVSDADVQACSEVTAYALSLREWAVGVADASLDPREPG